MPFDFNQFSDSIRQQLLEKMSTKTLIQMRNTCERTNSFIEELSSSFAGHVDMGCKIHIQNAKDGIGIEINRSSSTVFHYPRSLKIEPGFEKKLSGIPVKEIYVTTKNYEKLLEGLRLWKPRCSIFVFDQIVDFATYEEITKCIWVADALYLAVSPEDFHEKASDFVQVANFPGHTFMEIIGFCDKSGLLGKIRLFHFVSFTSIDPDSLVDVLQDIQQSPEVFNFTGEFIIRKYENLGRFPYVDCPDLHFVTIYETILPLSILYGDLASLRMLYLKSGKALLIREHKDGENNAILYFYFLDMEPFKMLNSLLDILCYKKLDIHSSERKKFFEGGEAHQRYMIRKILNRMLIWGIPTGVTKPIREKMNRY